MRLYNSNEIAITIDPLLQGCTYNRKDNTLTRGIYSTHTIPCVNGVFRFKVKGSWVEVTPERIEKVIQHQYTSRVAWEVDEQSKPKRLVVDAPFILKAKELLAKGVEPITVAERMGTVKSVIYRIRQGKYDHRLGLEEGGS